MGLEVDPASPGRVPVELLRRPPARRRRGGRGRPGLARRVARILAGARATRAARRSSSLTATSTTSPGVAELAEATGAPVHMPAAEREPPRAPERLPPAGHRRHASRRTSPEVPLRGDERARARRHRFETLPRARAHRRVTSRSRPTAALFSGDVLFAGSVGRVDRPGRELGGAPRLDPHARRAVSRRRPSSTRATARPTTLERELATNPFLGRAPGRRPVKIEAPRGHARRPAGGPAAAAQRSSRRPRLPPPTTATASSSRPTFEDTELFARTSGQGSDVVQKEMYTFEDKGGRSLTLRPEGTAQVARAYRRARAPPRAPARQDVLRRAHVPLRGAAEGALPRVLADRASRRWAPTTLRSTPS